MIFGKCLKISIFPGLSLYYYFWTYLTPKIILVSVLLRYQYHFESICIGIVAKQKIKVIHPYQLCITPI